MSQFTPISNPFPSVGSASLEDIPLNAKQMSQVVLPLTYPFGQVGELRKVCKAYLSKFPANAKEQGMCIMIRGDHGTGKTHTLADVLLRIASGQLDRTTSEKSIATTNSSAAPLDAKPRRAPLLLYAKAMTPSLVPVYKDLLGRVTAADLRELGLHALEALKSSTSPAPVKGITESFLGELKAGGALWREQSNALRPATGRRDEFPQAFSYVLAPELGRDTTLAEAARNWLAGQPISDADRDQLGVRGPITDPESAAQAIHFLATLCGFADHPLIMVIDQCEKLVATPDGPRPLETIRLLHTLVEVLPRENCLLILVGTGVAWRALPTDLQKRLGNNVIPCERLSLSLARNLVALYLNPKSQLQRTGDASDEDLEPFTPEAIRDMLERGGGGLRQLMQLASRAFDLHATMGGPIDASFMAKAAGNTDVQANDPESVQQAVRNVLQVRSLRFAIDFEVNDQQVDFAILLPNGEPRVLIKVSRSSFFLDETDRAQDLLRLARAAYALPSRPLLIPIIAGYASPEVLKALEKVTHAVIVYDADGFQESLGAILDALPPESTVILAASSPAEALTSPLLQRITGIETALAQLATARQPAHQAIEFGLEAEAQRQAGMRQEERRRGATVAWLQERSRIEDQIKQTRSERERTEIAELTKLRDAGEAERRRRVDLVTGLVMTLVIIACTVLGLSWSDDFRTKVSLEEQKATLEEKLESDKLDTAVDNKISEPKAREQGAVSYPLENFEVENKSSTLRRIREREEQVKLISQRLAIIESQSPIYSIGFAVCSLGLAIAIFRSLLARHLVGFAAARDLAAPVDAVHDLRNLAQAYVQRVIETRSPKDNRWHLVGLGPPITSLALLADPNPHFRYAAALTQNEPSMGFEFVGETLIAAIRAERSKVVRRALALAIGKSWPTLKELPNADLAADVPETAYWIEAAAELKTFDTRKWPKQHVVVDLLSGPSAGQDSNPAATIMSLFFSSQEASKQFAQAYNAGNVLQELSFLAQVSDFELREAIKTCSPFDQGGLGTLDRLRVIDKIDQMYLLFCQARSYKNWGDLLTLPSEPSRKLAANN